MTKAKHQQLAIRRAIAAKFDSALTTDDNRRHWGYADYLSPNASTNPYVRKILCSRSRYEVANNSYARGIVNSIANDGIGTGPTLQIQLDNEPLEDLIESEFSAWCEEIGLARLLRTLRVSRCESGEGFGIIRVNPGLIHPVKLDLQLVEAEQVSHDFYFNGVSQSRPGQFYDGIEYDRFDNPLRYYVLPSHPGDVGLFSQLTLKPNPIPAEYVLHYFRQDRPGQRRGVPELTPALPLFAQLRRYTLAVISAAETAADYAAVIFSESPPDDEGAALQGGEAVDSGVSEGTGTLDTFELAKRMATVLPQGWKLGQVKAEQPTDTYDAFVWNILREIARCLNVPLTIAALDSSKSNLSAAYLDHQTYARSIEIDRADMESLLNRLLDHWLTEAMKLPGYLPGAKVIERFPRVWRWPSVGQHADPNKVASARFTDLSSGATTLPREYSKQGLSWEKEQISAAKSLGITVEEYRALLRQSIFKSTASTSPQTNNDKQEDDDDENEAPKSNSRLQEAESDSRQEATSE